MKCINKWYILVAASLLVWPPGHYAFGITNQEPAIKNNKDSIDNIFIRVVSSKPAVYTGEAFIVKYLLYNSVAVIDPETTADLKFKDCYQEQYPAAPNQATEKFRGKVYNVTILKQYLVVASNAGIMELPRLKIHVKINSAGNEDFFDQKELLTRELLSAPAAITINALPLPLNTVSFSGAVGIFKIKSFYKPSPKIENLLVYHLIINGTGNVKTAIFIDPKLPVGIDIYNANTTRHDTLTSAGIKAYLEYSFQLVANYRGKYSIPPVNFSFFDPEKKKYEIFNSQAYNWDVNTGPAMPPALNIIPKQPVDVFIKQDMTDTYTIYSYSSLYFILLIVGLLLFVAGYKLPYIKKLTGRYIEILRSTNARNQAVKNIIELIKDSSSMDEDILCKRLTGALCKYMIDINEEINKDNKALSSLHLETNLARQELPKDIHDEVRAFLHNQHKHRFGPAKAQTSDLMQRCLHLIDIIHALHKGRYA
ncbi:MAG TPA: hypothetical protein VK668_22765 [Mucilaginibacter sp.]|nr:hypothetical protein [Mucilaginibacter sp.]